MDDTVTLLELAQELGHDDAGRAIRRFLKDPDDGGAPSPRSLLDGHWRLSPQDADRVRERFAF